MEKTVYVGPYMYGVLLPEQSVQTAGYLIKACPRGHEEHKVVKGEPLPSVCSLCGAELHLMNRVEEWGEDTYLERTWLPSLAGEPELYIPQLVFPQEGRVVFIPGRRTSETLSESNLTTITPAMIQHTQEGFKNMYPETIQLLVRSLGHTEIRFGVIQYFEE